jgi:hypothetical protein
MAHVFIRQAVEGRKIDVMLWPDDLQMLLAGKAVQVDDQDAAWNDKTHETAEADEEPTAVVQITLTGGSA